MYMCDPLQPCSQFTCHHGQWCNEVGVMVPIVPLYPSASSADRFALQSLGFVLHVDRFLLRIIWNLEYFILPLSNSETWLKDVRCLP
ncbi:hypothetical protein TNCV_5032401 [Trichonephila clavipes]|nr:hypothetical protein TNCV_5032401 [Trichonephila clavipes]